MQDLGITAIELLPVFEFNELEYYEPIPGTDFYRYNFWGYSTVAFFAPMARFSAKVRPARSAPAPQSRGRPATLAHPSADIRRLHIRREGHSSRVLPRVLPTGIRCAAGHYPCSPGVE